MATSSAHTLLICSPVWACLCISLHVCVYCMCVSIRRGILHRADPRHRSRWHADCLCLCCHARPTTRRTQDSALFQRLWRHWNHVGAPLFTMLLTFWKYDWWSIIDTNYVANSWCFILSDSLAVVVEDSSSSCCVTVKVLPHMTTAALKQQVSLKNASPLRLSSMESR